MPALRLLAAAFCAALPACAAPPRPPSPPPPVYDVLIRGGRVLDGSGNPWYRADVAVAGDRIAAVGELAGARARRVIDAEGRYVAPGFIDTHSHAGPGLATPALGGAAPLLAQGVTAVVVNPDGGGAADLERAGVEIG